MAQSAPLFSANLSDKKIELGERPVMKPRVALVVQRYGPEVNGGAEDAARWLAEALTAVAHIDVITTCALDYTTWANHYPPGQSHHNGVTIHRFPVDAPRNWQQSQKETGRLLLSKRTLDEEIAWIREQGPFSTPLLQFIKQQAGAYDAFIFMTYLYATTFFGLPLVADKAILIPAAHDEPFIYMDAYRALLNMPRHIVYLTEAERDLTLRVAGNGRIPHHVMAIGVKTANDISPARFRQKYGVQGDFLLYAGRISEAKNIPELCAFFQRYRREYPHPLKLVLMGKSHLTLPPDSDIIPVGFVSNQDKFDALSAASLFVLPSLFESLSIIILEAWLANTAVVVNGRCAVTRSQCQRSQGGLYYTTYDEFAAVLERLLTDTPLRQQLAENGRHFVRQQYAPDHIISQYQAILQSFSSTGQKAVPIK
jgi:glycosyltransferase involved in cell wall biosynthesis